MDYDRPPRPRPSSRSRARATPERPPSRERSRQPSQELRERRRKQRRRGRIRLLAVLLVITAGAAFAALRLLPHDPPPAVLMTPPATTEEAPTTSAMTALTPVLASEATDMIHQPVISAKSYIAYDVGSNQFVLAYHENDERPIASLTKMMTGLLAAEAGDPSHQVVASATAVNVEPNIDGLLVGHKYARSVLLYSALLSSNNDAAAALGEDVGGTLKRFYRMMNKRARELGMTRTLYASASGLNDAGNFSTARDQAIMLAQALKNPVFAQATGTWRYSVAWPDDTTTHIYENHNKMLKTFPGTIGGKTGFTTRAGLCLAVAVERNGRLMIAVILNSKDVWTEMPKLVNAAFLRPG